MKRLMILCHFFSLLNSEACNSPESKLCCSGFHWDRIEKKCTPCMDGYRGWRCRLRCVFPDFGKNCSLRCNCTEEQCHHVSGCRTPPKMQTSPHDFVTTSNEKESEEEEACMDGYRGWKCRLRCAFPDFGKSCSLRCNCTKEQCHHVSGCRTPQRKNEPCLQRKNVSGCRTPSKMRTSPHDFVTTSNEKESEEEEDTRRTRTYKLKITVVVLSVFTSILIVSYILMILFTKKFRRVERNQATFEEVIVNND